jgi:hypothetical protein
MFTTFLLLLSLATHPYHVTIAEATWNEDRTRLQVALRMSPRDLDAALCNTTGRLIVLEKESPEATRELVETYLKRVIFLRDELEPEKLTEPKLAKTRGDRFHWVGIEDEIRYVWVYFELEKAADVQSLWLTNRIFFETEPTQINTFQVLKTEPPIALRTTREEPGKLLPRYSDSNVGR